MNRVLKYLALICVVITCLLSFVYSTDSGTIHEVNIIIEHMAFTPDTETLSIKEGDTIRLIIHNEDVGMTHAFEIEELNIRMRNIHYSETVSVDIDVDDLSDQLDYACQNHFLMEGTILLTR